MKTRTAYPPLEIEPASYGDIATLMVTTDTTVRDSAVRPDVNGLGVWHTHNKPSNGDSSFTRQINELRFRPRTAYGLSDTQPQAYLFTAMSAIPVAAAVQGFYDELGEETPPLSMIRASSGEATLHRDIKYPEQAVLPLCGKRNPDDFKRQEANEVARLANIIGRMEHVCIVDQFTNTGGTLKYAGYLAHMAGAQTVSFIRGRWYHQWTMRAEDETILHATEYLHSAHYKFMHQVGQLACRGEVNRHDRKFRKALKRYK